MSAVKAVIFDWAGTTIDFGSLAPMGTFVEVFKRFGVDISIEEARVPMGLPKWDHIQALGRLPRVAEGWQQAHGRPFTDKDVDAVYEIFVPANAAIVTRYSSLIPGTVETMAAFRERGIKVGSTTGYTRSIMEPVLPLAAAQGYAPENLVCADDLPIGRPTPMMMYKCFLDLQVWPAAACIKVDDTEPGLAEGVAAGSWAVGVAVSGNAFGLAYDDMKALSPQDYADRRAKAVDTLTRGGADFVIDTIADLPPVIDEIERRMAAGQGPG